MSAGPDLSPTLKACSAQRRAGVSTTLPRNFAPLCLDPDDPPRTPDQTFAQIDLPPPPPRSTYRVRRPRLNLNNFQARNNALPNTLFASEIPMPSSAGPFTSDFSIPSGHFTSDDLLPSVETAASPLRPAFVQSYSEPVLNERLHLPSREEVVPRTPPSQTSVTPTEMRRMDWDMRRAASACSYHSDSSLSTDETFETRPTSFDGSTTSPEVDPMDPFSPSQNVKIIPATPSRKSKKIRLNSFMNKDSVHWTIDMDNHLFNVYQMYLADPTLTPFKTVPGSIPPTGVCHRVARRAKETWPRASRIDVPLVRRYKVRNIPENRKMPRARTPDPENFLSTGDRDVRNPWPSESATRKRLKLLCREKFTISAHYNRLRQSRSPSPFADQFLPRRTSSRSSLLSMQHSGNTEVNAAYATRELGISLVSSGATAPLAQLVTGDSPILDQKSDEWFNTPIKESDDMSVSPPTGLGIKEAPQHDRLMPAADIPRLASPFSYNTWNGPSRPDKQHRRHVSQNQFDTIHATGPRLLSPFRPEPDVSMNANKRRAQHNLEDELSPNGSSLAGHASGLNLGEPATVFNDQAETRHELVFTGLGDISQRRIRLRNRGATLGSAHERIERLFAPPPSQQQDDVPPVPTMPFQYTATTGDTNVTSLSSSLMPPQVEESQKRLGSPFELDPNKRSLRSKSPRHLPSLSDPFIHFTHGTASSSAQNSSFTSGIGNIGERLASFEQALDENRNQHQDANM